MENFQVLLGNFSLLKIFLNSFILDTAFPYIRKADSKQSVEERTTSLTFYPCCFLAREHDEFKMNIFMWYQENMYVK